MTWTRSSLPPLALLAPVATLARVVSFVTPSDDTAVPQELPIPVRIDVTDDRFLYGFEISLEHQLDATGPFEIVETRAVAAGQTGGQFVDVRDLFAQRQDLSGVETVIVSVPIDGPPPGCSSACRPRSPTRSARRAAAARSTASSPAAPHRRPGGSTRRTAPS